MKKTLFFVVALLAFATTVNAETVKIRQHTYQVLEYKHPIGSGSDWRGGLAGLSRDEYPAYATRVTKRIFQMFSQRVPGRMESGDFDSVQRQVLRQLWELENVYISENGYFFGMSHKNGVTMAPAGHIFQNRTGQTLRGVGVEVDIPGGWRLRALLQNEPGVHTGENCGNVVLTEIWKKRAQVSGSPQPCEPAPKRVVRHENRRSPVLNVLVNVGVRALHKELAPQPRRAYRHPHPQKRVKANKKSVHKVERHWQVNSQTGQKRLLYQKKSGRVQEWERSQPQPGPRPYPRQYRR